MIMSNKKDLLNEATVRRFMTLSGQPSLSENFFEDSEITEEDIPAEEDVMGDEMPPEPEDELPEEGEGDGEADITDEEADVLIGLGRKLEAAQEPEAPAEEEPLGDMGPPAEEEMPEDVMEGIQIIDDSSLVSEVMKRVVSRLTNKS
jgi:hypothetical protein